MYEFIIIIYTYILFLVDDCKIFVYAQITFRAESTCISENILIYTYLDRFTYVSIKYACCYCYF